MPDASEPRMQDGGGQDPLFERAVRVIPGGVNSPVRAFNAVGGTPLFVESAAGAYITARDGRRYVDLVQSWGPLPLGHAHPNVVAAARSALEKGSTFGAPTEGEVQLAEFLVDAVPSLESVRLVNSGTEAVMSALRVARAATGKRKFIKFAGHYHGHADPFLVAAGSGLTTLGVPDSLGVTSGTAADTIVVEWNRAESVDGAMARHGDDLAAIVCEPVPANMNLVPAEPGFLESLRAAADKANAVLIFDEVITGFRLGRGGAQATLGVTPDLTTLGKAIGGGFPLAAFGGRADLMELLAPVGGVYQAGTLSGNPVAVAAGLAQLRLLGTEVFTHLADIATRLAHGLADALADALAPIGASVTRFDTLVGLVFAASKPVTYQDVRAADHDLYAKFFHAMLERGVYLPPSGYEVLFVATPHDGEPLERVIQAAREAALAIAGNIKDA